MFITVLCTVPSEEAGRKIAQKLLESRLAACVNITSPVKSMYWWKGEIQEESELMLIIKTKLAVYNEIENEIKTMHPYDVPEIIALPIVIGSRPYLDWINGETIFTDDDPGIRNF